MMLQKSMVKTQKELFSVLVARVELLNATGSGIEGETIEVCCELVSNGGGINRPLSLTMLIRNGTANSMSYSTSLTRHF